MSEPVAFGGQAVLEGVMMRGPAGLAVAVRKGSDIALLAERRPALTRRYPLLRLPVLRGLASLGESLVLGTRALLWSAREALPDGEAMGPGELNLTVALALVAAVGLFVVLPTAVASSLRRLWPSPVALNAAEGLLRAGILLGYLFALSRLPDMQRVLAYHGAEHKAIHTLEAGEALTVANARRHSRFHPRCGTSFLLFAVLVSIALFALFGWPVLWKRIAVRVGLLPLVAGLGYEVLRLSARHRSALLWPVVAPGLWLQRLTTREPDDGQLEVALRALAAAREV